ncbi:Ubiquitin carboxyl-terminal hydrolase 48 [Grifola frondosa]|uniref:Ubiquitin carboxyl-terminal hydrolase 48 n=1 Tax=Grifola frondosa TaxID=5627 RepID=A0A1C7MGC3_GRIFR|nr:Ubiquitin carboxyl-terminal hydrolase 48 [Grifola frondosa]
MPPKRIRRISPAPAGLAAGERLKRAKLTGSASYSAWGWIGTEVTDASDITQEHRLATCGFSRNNSRPLCINKYASKSAPVEQKHANEEASKGELEDDVIVISDDDTPSCSSKGCKSNPYCLNYLSQEKWEDPDKAYEAYLKVINLGENPLVNSREPSFPVGLKNLGATCYANAFLQVWYQDLPFRSGVYRCQPSQDAGHTFEDSPIFQLQVTFAAMQQCIQSAFNPVKLVESLKLRTSEQQDAQEFSKLFMAHLDTEFQKQASPALKSLVADQFQGTQVYNTVCENCHRRSERESDFLEIEVNLQNHATLEERISASLEPETLSEDNRYFCPQCSSLQDAKRYTELRELPPILHFSLLRFVYDLSSMERKKCKHTICFPTTLDMDHFVGSAEMRKQAKKRPSRESKNLYELRGVLLHKGASAYHGHYEAQVFDVQNQSWYQFNDETVTKIESLIPKGLKANGSKTDETCQWLPETTRDPKKRRRVDDSDSEIEILKSSPSTQNDEEPTATHISSKDAYMLVYSRVGEKGSPVKTELSTITLTPPDRALGAVNILNAAHDKACEEFAERENQAKARFNDVRRMVMDIYRSWSLSSRTERCVVASRQALESKSEGAEASENDSVVISSSDIICSHGNLNPEKANDMKAISEPSYLRIISEDHCEILPKLSPSDVCDVCVRDSFIERLYQVEHPRLVARFDEISSVRDDEQGFYISKSWLKDWRLAKPKMHIDTQPDPPPDAPDYEPDVICEHGDLATNSASRRRISVEAYHLLQHLFPSWKPLSTAADLCPVCEALLHISKEDKRELRKQAEDEKAKLRHMHDNALNGNTVLLENVPCAIVPAQFIRSWRQWLLRPGEVCRPEGVDNSSFICEHGMLVLDPNSASDLDSSVAIIKRSDWDVLEELYSGGPLIAVENTGVKMEHELPVCDECRQKRRSTYEMTEITVRVLGPSDPIPSTDSYREEPSQPRHISPQPTLLTYGSRKAGGLRKSHRIRQVKEPGKRRRVTITKAMTVKELKVMLQDDLDIPVISQRLFYKGHELDDSSATLLSLGILSNDLLDLREESEDVNLLSDSDTENPKSKGRREGQGFGGTLLGGSDSQRSSSHPASPTSKPCSACTFENVVDASSCTICDTPFPSDT